MKTLATGVDLVEISRVRWAIERQGEKFLHRIYTAQELEQVGKNIDSLAVRFAAKEAVSKALGCGIGDVSWQEIEILRDDLDAPELRLHGAALQKAGLLGLHSWSVSLSHTNSHAIAMVVAIGD